MLGNAPELLGQANTATVLGLVQDSIGAVLPGATVTLTNVKTNLVRITITNDMGQYEIPLLPIGEYSITVEQSGFKKLQRSGILLSEGQRARLDLSLMVGDITETVAVTADAPLVNAVGTDRGVTMESHKIVDLPLRGRNFSSLVLLQAGVTQTQSGGANQSFAFEGGHYHGVNFTLDGTDASAITAPTTGGRAIFFTSWSTPSALTISWRSRPPRAFFRPSRGGQSLVA